ncbi:unnamed protein product [Sphacelaria rigidula]
MVERHIIQETDNSSTRDGKEAELMTTDLQQCGLKEDETMDRCIYAKQCFNPGEAISVTNIHVARILWSRDRLNDWLGRMPVVSVLSEHDIGWSMITVCIFVEQYIVMFR